MDNIDKNKDKEEYAIIVDDVDKSFDIVHNRVDNVKGIFTNPAKVFRQNKERFNALSDVSFEIKKGEFIGIIGKNGCGKSTLLKIIAGIYKPDKGNVVINGSLVPFLELGVGFNQELTARENIFLNGTILGMTRAFLKKKFDEIVDFAEIREFIDTPIKNFSSGMVVRLAFSIAIQAKADIYLLDEVFSVGDEGFRRKSMKKLFQLIEDGATILYVSHSLDSVRSLTSRCIYIKNGRIIKDSTPDESVSQYEKDLISGDDSRIMEDHWEEETKDLLKDMGDGRAKIKSVEILNLQGESVKSIYNGEDFQIILKADIEGTILHPLIYVGFHSPLSPGIYLYSYNTPRSKDGVIRSLYKGDKLEVRFKGENKLLPSKYIVRAHIEDANIEEGGWRGFASLYEQMFEVNVISLDENISLKKLGHIDHEYEYRFKVTR